MKSNTPIGEKTLWRTPAELIRAVERRFGQIALDCAASEGAEVCDNAIRPEQDSLKPQPWSVYAEAGVRGKARCRPRLYWLNSPWGAGITHKWVKRAVEEVTNPDRQLHWPDAILLLTPHSDAWWWWDAATHSSETLHLGRVPFIRHDGVQCGAARDWHDLHVLRPGVYHPGQAVISRWDWRRS